MFDIEKVLDSIKSRNPWLKYDRDVDRALGAKGAIVNHWRAGRSLPSDDMMPLICALAGRAKHPEVKAAYSRAVAAGCEVVTVAAWWKLHAKARQRLKTARLEAKVLEAARLGLTNARAAARLGISPGSVSRILRRALSRESATEAPPRQAPTPKPGSSAPTAAPDSWPVPSLG